MNLFSFLQRGAAHAPDPVTKAAEAARAQWLNALLVDETRAWMSLGEADRDLLAGYISVLTLAGFAGVYDSRNIDSAEVRVIRGAISAATQCAKAGCVVDAATAQALSSAAYLARSMVQLATVEAITHAAQQLQASLAAMEGEPCQS